VSEEGKATRRALSREVILDAAFRVVDADDMNEITMSRLGRELDADPSAVYRHFRNKDELLLAMADVMLEQTIDGYVEGDAPVENLRRMAWALRRSYLRRPGLARAVAPRFTGGEAEARCVRTMVANIRELGYSDEEAVARTRGLAELTLGHIVMTADVVALPTRAQAFEYEMGRSYYTYPRQALPTWDVSDARAENLADGERVFHTIIEGYLAGLVAGAAATGRATLDLDGA
jgi:AcrR family transcriptional regulator